MASFGANTPMLPCAKDDNARVTVWAEHVGKELAALPRNFNRPFRVVRPQEMEAVQVKAGLQHRTEGPRITRRTLAAEQGETERLRQEFLGMVPSEVPRRGPRRIKPGGAPATPPRAQSLPAEHKPGAFGVHGAEPERSTDPPPADSLDEFRGQFMEQLSKASAGPRQRGVQKPRTSQQEFGFHRAKRISQPALERLTERTRLSSCKETKYGSNYALTWGRGLYQARRRDQ